MEEESTKAIQRIIQRGEVHGGWIFIGRILGKIMNVSVTKVTSTAGGPLVEKRTKKTSKRK